MSSIDDKNISKNTKSKDDRKISYSSIPSIADPNDLFFKYIHDNDITNIRKFFRNLEYKPWEFLESGGFTGNLLFILLLFYFYTFILNFTSLLLSMS